MKYVPPQTVEFLEQMNSTNLWKFWNSGTLTRRTVEGDVRSGETVSCHGGIRLEHDGQCAFHGRDGRWQRCTAVPGTEQMKKLTAATQRERILKIAQSPKS